jgi:hypothetical protein
MKKLLIISALLFFYNVKASSPEPAITIFKPMAAMVSTGYETTKPVIRHELLAHTPTAEHTAHDLNITVFKQCDPKSRN